MSSLGSLGRKFTAPRFLLVLLAAAAFALPFSLLFSPTAARADGDPVPDIIAVLRGEPIGGITPVGISAYFVSESARRLVTHVSHVNLPEHTELTVFLNDTSIGTIMLDDHRGTLFLSTEHGDTVPEVVAGDVLSVRNGETTILEGPFTAFVTPTPEPSHTPTASPTPFEITHFFAALTGPPIGGVIPRGFSAYVSFNDTRRIDVFVAHVNLPEDEVLTVNIGGIDVGTITLDDHQGALHLDTRHGDTVPAVQEGTPITITQADGTVVLSGVYTNMPPSPSPTATGTPEPSETETPEPTETETPEPSHTPTASPTGTVTPEPSETETPEPSHTPTASPTGSPTPRLPHVFGARLNGANEVPPVETDGRGMGLVLLNREETSISVRVQYHRHLSSDVTAITINGPAMPGENAPVIFSLDLPTPPHSVARGTFTITPEQLAELRAGLWYFQIATVDHPDGEIRGQIHSINHRDDFGDDGISDISVTRSSVTGEIIWYVLNSADQTVRAATFGQSGDLNVQGDYDGDGIADVSVFTPATGNWQIKGSATDHTVIYHWGSNGDIPVVGDYDSDGINDLAVFRPSDGNWYIRRSTDLGTIATHFGTNGDRPVSGDFDGDGRNDLTVFRPSTGDWYINRSSDGQFAGIHWGTNGDRPVAGDFDGDGLADVAVFRPSDGNWYINRSSDGQFTAQNFGLAGDIPVPCEFDGDGLTDIAVFRPSDGNWYITRSSDQSVAAYHFGIATDRPGPAIYAP